MKNVKWKMTNGKWELISNILAINLHCKDYRAPDSPHRASLHL
jgi:hypothetical protein